MSSRAEEALDFCRHYGLTLDGWQEDVLSDSLQVMADGDWAASEVGIVVPRQNGKGVILEARELVGLFLLDEPLISHSAHLVDTSLEHFRRLLATIEDSDLEQKVRKVRHTNGQESIELMNGHRIRFGSRSRGLWRGSSGDVLVLDEAMFLPEFAINATLPSLSAQGRRQTWYAGSAVDQEVHEHGVVFARVRERGIAGDSKRLTFYEWSPAYDGTASDVDPSYLADLDVIASANPAFPHRVSVAAVEMEREAMSNRGYAVERACIGDWPRTDGQVETVISIRDWQALIDGQSQIDGPACLAYDVSPDRRSSIALAGRRADGKFHIEIVENARGTGWLAGRIAEIESRNDIAAIVCDGFGPAAGIVPQIEEFSLTVETTTAGEMAQACGGLEDAVADQTVRHLGSDEIANAIRGAKTRPLGDRWAWARRSSSTDISPLVAGTVALWAAMKQPVAGESEMLFL